MYDIIFYFFSVFIIAAALHTAFSDVSKKMFIVFTALLISAQGLMILLNLQFLAVIAVFFILAKLSFLITFFPNVKGHQKKDSNYMPKPYLSITVISILTALIASLIASARWREFDINFTFNNYGSIFMKYSPLFILLGLLTAVFLSSLNFILNRR